MTSFFISLLNLVKRLTQKKRHLIVIKKWNLLKVALMNSLFCALSTEYMCSAWLRVLFVGGIGSKVPLASIIAQVLSILSLTRFSVAWSGKIFSSGIWVAEMVSLISQLSALGGEILLIVANALTTFSLIE